MGIRTFARNVKDLFTTRSITEAKYPFINLVSDDGRPFMNATASLNLASVWNACDLLSGHIATLPLILYRRTSNSGKERATDHPLFRVLSIKPNSLMTSFQMRQSLVLQQELYGDSYTWVFRPGNGLIELWPLTSRLTFRDKDSTGKVIYRTQINGVPYTIPGDQIIHIPILTLNGIDGINPIIKRRRSLTIMQSAEDQVSSYYKNSSKPHGALKIKEELSPEAFDRLKVSWEETHNGTGNHHKTAILEGGTEWQQIQFNAEEIQMLGSRHFSVTEVARWFNIPPHKLKDLERSTFSNIEHQNIDYVTDSLLPRLTRIEQAMTNTLLTPKEQETYFIEFLVEGLLRGDIKTRYEAYQIARQNGALNADEWRAKENMNPIGDESGKVFMVPMNMMSMDQLVKESKGSASDKTRTSQVRSNRSTGSRRTLTNRFKSRYRNLATTILREEIPKVKAIISSSGDDRTALNEALDSFYETFAEEVSKLASGLIQVNADEIRLLAESEIGSQIDASQLETFITRYIETFGKRYAIKHKEELKKRETKEQMEEQADHWNDVRPDEISAEPIRVENAVSRTVWMMIGIVKIRSVAHGKNCPYCNELNGRIIGIDEAFLTPGEFKPEGAESSLRVTHRMTHPPYHGGCDCSIEPVLE